MCGIAGLIDPALDADRLRTVVQRMTDAIVHRGPDDEGCFITDGVAIAMRRLSIIDVNGGQQPIANEDNSVQVVFNGEIYNYLERRDDLLARGHTFRTRSDTEVIVHGYEERGIESLNDLRGMFGIAIWDANQRRLLLARDRLGKKPLYYAQDGDRLLFGSEIKAILAAAPHLAEPNSDAIVPYFRFGFVPEPATMFRRIWKLPAAHWLTFENDSITLGRYWSLQFDDEAAPRRTLSQWAEELDALLAESVRIRLMSEVPLGIFLSGGLDSSAIVAYAQRAMSQPVKTFTIGFDREAWDESADAAIVARHCGTEHHVLRVTEQDLTGDLPSTLTALVRHFDEPFGDSSSIPTYIVSRLAREHVTVVLGGDGGDELFAGYSTYRGLKFADHYRRLPNWFGGQMLPSLVNFGAGLLLPGRRYSALRIGKVLADSSLPIDQAYASKVALCSDDLLRKLLIPDLAACLERPLHQSLPSDVQAVMNSTLPTLSKVSYADLRFRLLDDMLVKVDRMSMAHSLEARTPFLDHHLVEFAATMPSQLKLRGWETKAILRDVVKRYLPSRTIQKRKQGFGVPLRDWLRSELGEMVEDYLGEHGPSRLPDSINRQAARQILAEHRAGLVDHRSIIWLLLNYAVWDAMYIRGRSIRPPDTDIQSVARTSMGTLSRGGEPKSGGRGPSMPGKSTV